MGLFDSLREPILLKTTSSAKNQLSQIEPLLSELQGKAKDVLSQDIAMIKAGIYGEDNLLFELKNSHLPMYILHDIYITHGDLSAQIDFIVVTRKITYIIECKNLLGDIEIRNNGDFIRNFKYNGKTIKEGLYSPITQNERHLQLIRQKRAENKGTLNKLIFEKYFDSFNRAIVVLANPKSVLNDRYAPKEIKKHVIKADQLVRYIKETNDASKESSYSDKEMESLANLFLEMHEERNIDYTAKYVAISETDNKILNYTDNTTCPKCGKKLIQRKGKYGVFWGCEGYPSCKFTSKI